MHGSQIFGTVYKHLHLTNNNCYIRYLTRKPNLVSQPPSDSAEIAFANVATLYVKHQFAWDNADIVEEVDEDFYESEPEDNSGDEEQ